MPRPVRRATLPGASELFRPTQSVPDLPPPAPAPAPEAEPVTEVVERPDAPAEPRRTRQGAKKRAAKPATPAATGRVRHDQKITVYFSSDELFALEDATLDLRRRHGLSLDRGRLVRTAVALALADLAEHGEDSAVIAELREQ